VWPSLLFALAAQAADDGFTYVRDSHECRLESRPKSHASGSAMRAICEWPEVDPEVLGDLMADLDGYEELIFALVQSEVRERRDGRRLVYQRQSVFGISDREVLLWATISRDDGATTVRWSTADEVPLALDDGSIRTPRNEGYWRVEPREGGGARVVHEIGVDAGGRIPDWIVKLVRNRGFMRVMKDVRSKAVEAGASPDP